jgi:hypothetical protein
MGAAAPDYALPDGAWRDGLLPEHSIQNVVAEHYAWRFPPSQFT